MSRKTYRLRASENQKPWPCKRCGGRLFSTHRTTTNEAMTAIDRERKCLHCGHLLRTREQLR